ncbi:SRPBCC family protein [Amycolatopsis sp. NPDC059090]|uniref:SRPBCC family protein n=1 Tax=unclassified Amycolatopsis TaxID=2618356 RepID=UPI003672BCEA
MLITNEIPLPVPPAEAWPVLLDLEKIAPCLPGAAITGVDGESYEGKAKIKVGPITAEYRGVAEFVSRDETARRAVIRATGKDARGQGNVSATIDAHLVENGPGSTVVVRTELDITGKLAQFGRGVINDAAGAILATFAERLAGVLTASPAAGVEAPTAPGEESLDLLRVAKDARTAKRAERPAADPAGTLAALVSLVAAAIAMFAAGLAIGRSTR